MTRMAEAMPMAMQETRVAASWKTDSGRSEADMETIAQV